MHFLLWSRIGERDIRRSLGLPEYSYFFLLKELRPLFERLGSVEVIDDPVGDAARISRRHAARGEPCVLIAFTAPHNVPSGIECPVIPLFAWEFERIPDEPWDDRPQHDWRVVLRTCGRAITLSQYAARATRRALGEEYPVLAIPLPLWERIAAARALCAADPGEAGTGILVDGVVFEAGDYTVTPTRLEIRDPLASHEFGIWDGADFELDLRHGSGDVGALGGFYLAEPWGSWSRNAEVWVCLPYLVHGRIRVDLVARAYGNNVGRPLLVGMNERYQPLRLGSGPEPRRLVFELETPTNVLRVRGIDVSPPPGGQDERTLGIGLSRLGVSRLGSESGADVSLDFRLGSPDVAVLRGFHEAETWGTWSHESEPAIDLPEPVGGRVRVELRARAFAGNAGRELWLDAGAVSAPVSLGADLETRTLRFNLDVPVRQLRLRGLTPAQGVAENDSRSLGIGVQRVRVQGLGGLCSELDLRAGSPDCALLQGFHDPEAWGTWSRSPTPWLVLETPVEGRVQLQIEAMAFGANIGRRLQVYLGRESRELVLSGEIECHTIEFDLTEPAQVLGFFPVISAASGEGEDMRALGVGLRRVVLQQESTGAASIRGGLGWTPAHVRHLANIDGVVYASVLNPCDGRKNWRELLTAFCTTFADCPDATLVLKMTHHAQSSYLFELQYLLQRLPRFACRVVFIHGYLQEEDYARLIRASHFYVNLSRAEGLCIPLMEFMGCGRPAIAPWHTAMLDYLDASNSIPVVATPEPCVWPHDERNLLRTLQYRVDWESAEAAFRRSRELYLHDREAYARMAAAAAESMRNFCGIEGIAARLEAFLRGHPAGLAPAGGAATGTVA